MPGPLEGLRIVEFAGIGPGPFGGMMLADHGAEVIRIDRASGSRGGSQPVTSKDVLARGRKSIAIDLKSAEGVALAEGGLKLIAVMYFKSLSVWSRSPLSFLLSARSRLLPASST